MSAATPSAELQSAALAYIERGWALTWMKHGQKAPSHAGWNTPEQVVRTPEQARQVWNGTPRNIGLVHKYSRTGSFDLDKAEWARQALADVGIDLDDLVRGVPCVQGNPANFRLLFRQPKGIELPLVKLAWPDPNDSTKKITVFELRAEANQDVLPPSLHPGTGKPYIWLHPLPDNPADHPEPPPALRELWTNWSAWEPLLQKACPWAKQEPERARTYQKAEGANADVIGKFNDAHDVRALLEANGYKPRGKNRYLPPNSTSGVPSVRILDSGRAYSDNGSCPLNDGYAHDAFDVYRILAHGGDFKAAVKAAAKELGMDTRPKDNTRQDAPPEQEYPRQEWPDPEPLQGTLKPVERFRPELLPEPFMPWVRDIAERMQCPPDYAGIAAMVALSAVVGRKVGIHPKQQDDWLVVPNLWGVAIGRPSTMKTPALEDVLKPLKRLEIEAKEQFEAAMLAYTAESGLLDLKRDAAKKDAQKRLKEGNEQEARTLLMETAQDVLAPARRRYIVSDATVEKLGEILNENPHGVLLVRDELSGFLKTIDREDRSNDRAFYLQCFNGTGRYTYDRIGRGTIDIESLTVSILGGIQPAKFLPYIAGAVKGSNQDDGMMQRLQLAVYPDLARDWQYVDRWPDKAAKDRAYDVFKRLAEWTPVASEEGEIPAARFDNEAQALFKEWLTDLETELRGEDIHPALEAHFAKYRKLTPALALLIHLAELAHANALPEQADTIRVSRDAFIRAAAWGEYLKSHAERIYALGIYSNVTNAKTLLAKLKAGKLKVPVKARAIQQAGWSGLTEVEDIRKALGVLEDHGYLRAEELPTTERGGRPAVIYHVHPSLGGGGHG